MPTTDLIQLVALVLSAIALVVALTGIRNQLWLQMFTHFTDKFLAIIDSMPEEARLPKSSWSLASLAVDERKSLTVSLRHYFNLCSEEFYLHKHRRIDRETWRIWTRGMAIYMSLPAFKEGWETLRTEYDYFPDFQSFMDEMALRGLSALSRD